MSGHGNAVTVMTVMIGEQIGDVYSVTGLVGSGGMGTVYRGLHKRLNRPVAIKVLHSTAGDRTRSEGFLTEARLQASLRHPRIATLYDFVTLHGQGCIIMEFIDGPTLADALRSRGSLSVPEALSILRQVCEAVQYLHAQGIVHRDLKPANIKLHPQSGVKILDFGIARPLDAIPPHDRVLAATFEYTAPECLAGKPADVRSDIWSLGVVVYEAITGGLPFQGSTLDELSRLTAGGRFSPASALAKGVDRELDRLIARCLQPKPEQRLPSVDELLRELDRRGCSVPRLRPARKLWIIPAAVMTAVMCGVLVRGWRPHSTVLNGEGRKSIDIDVVNGPAEVFRNGRDIGATPIHISEPPGEQISLLLKRPGFDDLPVEFEVDERSSYSYVLHESGR